MMSDKNNKYTTINKYIVQILKKGLHFKMFKCLRVNKIKNVQGSLFKK